MQLTLAFIETHNRNHKKQDKYPTAEPWDQLDEVARVTALEILARLIAQMVAA
jgi:hypothetical protein